MGTVKFEKVSINNGLVIVRTFYGDISIPEVIDSFKYLIENEFKDNQNIIALLTDLTKATIKFKLNEFRSMISYIKHDEQLSILPLGVIVDSPVNTIFPTIASKVIGIKVKPFNTFDEAMEWALSEQNK